MKKYLLSLVIFTITSSSTFGQTSITSIVHTIASPVKQNQKQDVSVPPVKIVYEKDKYTEKEYIATDRNLILTNDSKTRGFSIYPLFRKDNNGKWVYSSLAGRSVGIGSCNDESDLLYVIFEDDTKVMFNGWREFNCTGKLGFDLSGKGVNYLKKPIKSIKYVCGRSSDSFEIDLVDNDMKTYFVSAFTALDEFNQTYKN